jgi:hypothetical protein
MGTCIYKIVKAPVGWSVFCDGMRIGGVYGTKAALEAAAVAASFPVRDGQGIQINVPEAPGTESAVAEAWPSKWNDLLK